jgi:hypothetical protein
LKNLRNIGRCAVELVVNLLERGDHRRLVDRTFLVRER